MLLNRSVVAVVGAVVIAPMAWAQVAYINSSLVTLDSFGGTVFNAKFRMSVANFDQSIATAGGTGTGNTVGYNLGNLATLNARTYQFTLEHRVGQGYIFTFLDNQPTPFTSVTAFGSGWSPTLPTPGPTVAVVQSATLRPSPGSTDPLIGPGDLPSYNSLRIEARASAAVAGFPEEEIIFSGLTFASPTITTVIGSFSSGTVTPTTPGTVEFPGDVPSSPANGFWYQRLVADVNLNDHDWTLMGTVAGRRNGTGDGEAWRFVIYGQQVDVTIVPEPGTYAALFGGGLFAFAILRRARRRASPQL